MTKILFLDIDETLYKPKKRGIVRRALKDSEDFDKESMGFLQELCADPDLKIVISSFWRTYVDLSDFKTIFANWKIDPDKIIDTTPILADDQVRGLEIQYWLLTHPEITITGILILDDQRYNFHKLWPDHWVHCTNLLNDENTRTQARAVLNMPVDYAMHSAIGPFIAMERGQAPVLFILRRHGKGHFFELCMGLKMSEEALCMRIADMVHQHRQFFDVTLDVFCLLNLYPMLNKLATCQPKRRLTLHLDNVIPVELVLQILSNSPHDITLYVNGEITRQIEMMTHWFSKQRWQGNLILNLVPSVHDEDCADLINILHQYKHTNVALYKQTTPDQWLLLDKPIMLNTVACNSDDDDSDDDTSYWTARPAQQSLNAICYFNRLLNILNNFFIQLIRFLPLNNFKDFESLELFFKTAIAHLFSQDNIGGYYHSQFKTLPGVCGDIELDGEGKYVNKIKFTYASHLTKVLFQYELDAGFQWNFFQMHMKVKRPLHAEAQQACTTIDLGTEVEREKSIAFLKHADLHGGLFLKSVAQTRLNVGANPSHNNKSHSVKVDEFLNGVASLSFN